MNTQTLITKAIVTAAGAAVLGGLFSCRNTIDAVRPHKDAKHFDPRAAKAGKESPAAGNLKFYKVRMSKAISPNLLKAPLNAIKIGPGDVLDIEIVETPFTQESCLVMPDGKLYYDLAGGVQAEGLTLQELEGELTARLQEHYPFPVVSVNMQRVQSRTYTILGQVKDPGSFMLAQPTTLLDAISRAGGVASAEINGRSEEVADLQRSIVVRNNKIIPADFAALIQGGDMRQNIFLQPGDYIFVPAAGTEKVYVLGAVNNPTTMPYSSRVNIVSALAQAQGLRGNAYTRRMMLIRGSLKDPTIAILDLRDILRGTARNFALEPGDIVWVPDAPWAKLAEYVRAVINTAATTVAVVESTRLVDGGDDNDVNININPAPASPSSSIDPEEDRPVTEIGPRKNHRRVDPQFFARCNLSSEVNDESVQFRASAMIAKDR